MRVSLNCYFNGFEKGSFFNKDNGEKIDFTRVVLLGLDDVSVMFCSAENEIDFSVLNRFENVKFDLDILDGRKPKILGFEKSK